MTWKIVYNQQKAYWIGRFEAMACPCTVFIDTDDSGLAHEITRLAYEEAQRIEKKFSRYRDDNIVHRINNANGHSTPIDSETYNLLLYAHNCYELSEGTFDITSGALGKLWKITSQTTPPEQQSIDDMLANVGWNKVSLEKDNITLQPDMKIDLGGVGKEYAVDKTLHQVSQLAPAGILVNFGGDIATNGVRNNGAAWDILLDNPVHPEQPGHIKLGLGAVATSGDSKRHFCWNGKRYGHILNAKTGWPIAGAPHSVSVIGNNCLEAGMLATFAILQGVHARQFLDKQGVDYICID